MEKNNLSKYLFGISAFIIVFFLSSYTNKLKIEKEHIKESDFSIDKEELNKLTDQTKSDLEINDTELLEDIDQESTETNNNFSNINKSIIVNSIKIAKQVDTDPNSNTYREPISAFKTITTLDQNIIKDIDYYPSFCIWTSINTENMQLNIIDESSEDALLNINPAKLSMIVTCNETEVSKFNFNINAKTPRWREWIEIDLTQFEPESIIGSWNIKIINNKNNYILEDRSFSFNKIWEIDELRQTAEIID